MPTTSACGRRGERRSSCSRRPPFQHRRARGNTTSSCYLPCHTTGTCCSPGGHTSCSRRSPCQPRRAEGTACSARFPTFRAVKRLLAAGTMSLLGIFSPTTRTQRVELAQAGLWLGWDPRGPSTRLNPAARSSVTNLVGGSGAPSHKFENLIAPPKSRSFLPVAEFGVALPSLLLDTDSLPRTQHTPHHVFLSLHTSPIVQQWRLFCNRECSANPLASSQHVSPKSTPPTTFLNGAGRNEIATRRTAITNCRGFFTLAFRKLSRSY